MSLKQRNIIKLKCYKICLILAKRLDCNCKKHPPYKCDKTVKKHKIQLKMIEDVQNLKTNTGIFLNPKY